MREVDSAEPHWFEVSDTVMIEDVGDCTMVYCVEGETGRGRS